VPVTPGLRRSEPGPGVTRRCRGERGSVLAIVPAGFLVLMLLGAIAVDSGATYLGQQQLQATVEAAANDAAGAALSDGAFYQHGAVQIDPSTAARVVCQDLGAQEDSRLQEVTLGLDVVGATIFVDAHAEVPAVFGRIVPGFARRPVSAEAGAVAAQRAGQDAGDLPAQSAFQPIAC
jgi:hypothetical protein